MTTSIDDERIAPPEAQADPASLRDPAAIRREHLAALRRRRKHLMLWAIPVAVLVLLVALKLISMVMIGNRTVQSYAAGDHETALNSSQQQKFLNVIEQWKAPYNTGTVYLQLGLNPEARVELEEALGLASGTDQCPVRANLAIAIERIGDASAEGGDRAAAEQAYQQALTVLQEAPPECQQSSSASPMNETQERVEQKLDPQSGEGEEEGEQNGQNEGPDGQTIDELEEQLGNNQDDRQDQITEDENQSSNDGYTDKPW